MKIVSPFLVASLGAALWVAFAAWIDHLWKAWGFLTFVGATILAMLGCVVYMAGKDEIG
jgi:hypothetical protein